MRCYGVLHQNRTPLRSSPTGARAATACAACRGCPRAPSSPSQPLWPRARPQRSRRPGPTGSASGTSCGSPTRSGRSSPRFTAQVRGFRRAGFEIHLKRLAEQSKDEYLGIKPLNGAQKDKRARREDQGRFKATTFDVANTSPVEWRGEIGS